MYEEKNQDALVDLFVDNGFIIPSDPQKMMLFLKESSKIGRDTLINKLIELKNKTKAKENITGFIPILMGPLKEMDEIINSDEYFRLSDLKQIDAVNELFKEAKNIGNFKAYDEAQKLMQDKKSFMDDANYDTAKALFEIQRKNNASKAEKTKMTLEICNRKEKIEKEFLQAAAAFKEEEKKLNSFNLAELKNQALTIINRLEDAIKKLALSTPNKGKIQEIITKTRDTIVFYGLETVSRAQAELDDLCKRVGVVYDFKEQKELTESNAKEEKKPESVPNFFDTPAPTLETEQELTSEAPVESPISEDIKLSSDFSKRFLDAAQRLNEPETHSLDLAEEPTNVLNPDEVRRHLSDSMRIEKRITKFMGLLKARNPFTDFEVDDKSNDNTYDAHIISSDPIEKLFLPNNYELVNGYITNTHSDEPPVKYLITERKKEENLTESDSNILEEPSEALEISEPDSTLEKSSESKAKKVKVTRTRGAIMGKFPKALLEHLGMYKLLSKINNRGKEVEIFELESASVKITIKVYGNSDEVSKNATPQEKSRSGVKRGIKLLGGYKGKRTARSMAQKEKPKQEKIDNPMEGLEDLYAQIDSLTGNKGR